MNDARFTGNLTRDPEAKAMSNGKLRCTFTLAVTRPYTNQQGQRDADFIHGNWDREKRSRRRRW